VLDRVLDERLQHERRHGRVEQGRWHRHLDPQPVAVPEPLDVGVRPHDVDLLTERDFRPALGPHGVGEERADAVEGLRGPCGRDLQQRRHRVQGVAEEVRLQLPLEHVEARRRGPLGDGEGGQLVRLAAPDD
jgi:hypothetical protein